MSIKKDIVRGVHKKRHSTRSAYFLGVFGIDCDADCGAYCVFANG